MKHRAMTDKAKEAASWESTGSSFVSQLWQSCAAEESGSAAGNSVTRDAQAERASDDDDSVFSRVGTVVADRWRIERVIGVGGMGVVYAATHRNGQRVALKFLRREFCAVPEARERFLAEARIANRLGHPAITRMSDDGETDDGCLYLVMELLQGSTLEEHLKLVHRPVPLERVTAILDTLLDVLEVAHKAGVLHRDIKPANIFLCDDGGVRLLDFGVARTDEARSFKTVTGVTLGTPTFMSPEQASGRWEEVDERSDLFALGATAYALLTGVNIRQAGTCSEELVLAMTKQVPSLAKLRPDLSSGWIAVIDCALQFAKEERFASAAAMRAALATCTADRAEAAFVECGQTLTLAPRGRTVRSHPGRAKVERGSVPEGAPAIAGVEPTLNVLHKHSVAGWQTPARVEAPRRSFNRWWGPAVVAALCLAPAIVGLRLSGGTDATEGHATRLADEPAVAGPAMASAEPVVVVAKPAPAEPVVVEAAKLATDAEPVGPQGVRKAVAPAPEPLRPMTRPVSSVSPQTDGNSKLLVKPQLPPAPVNHPPAPNSVAPQESASPTPAQRGVASALIPNLHSTSAAAAGVPALSNARDFDPLERRN
jgi:Protein kinase domain